MAQLFMRHAECTVRQRVLNMEYKRNANGTAQYIYKDLWRYLTWQRKKTDSK